MPVDSLRGVRVSVPAKINLHLSVGPVRPDGFHDLETVFHAVDLRDDVVAYPAAHLSVEISGDEVEGVPADGRNLAWQAAELLAGVAGLEPRARLQVVKRIPVAGGMAGGSADAAGALLACARLWDLDVDAAELTALAARLGSDVTFPLVGGTALGTGRGEILTPLSARPRLYWVLALADVGIPAGAAYAELDRLRDANLAPEPAGRPDRLVAALEDGTVDEVARHLRNDLQAASLALEPSLAQTLEAGAGAGALAGLVSGSGPTTAFLCRDVEHADEVAAALAASGTARAIKVASGPAPGARVSA